MMQYSHTKHRRVAFPMHSLRKMEAASLSPRE